MTAVGVVLLVAGGCGGSKGGGGGGAGPTPAATPTPAPPGDISVSDPSGVPGVNPADGSSTIFVRGSAAHAFAVAGKCAQEGETIEVAGAVGAPALSTSSAAGAPGGSTASPAALPAVTGSGTCLNGAWSVTLNLSALPDGEITLSAAPVDPSGSPQKSEIKTIIKDSLPPTLSIDKPADGSFVNISVVAAIGLAGKCSENGMQVFLTTANQAAGGAVGTPSPGGSGAAVCTGGVWQASLDLTSLANGTVEVSASLKDIAGNQATVSKPLVKNTTVPTLTLNAAGATSTAATGVINSLDASAFLVSGTCSEEGLPVAVSGAVTASSACHSGKWSLNLALLTQKDGDVTLRFDHADAAGNFAPTVTKVFKKNTVIPLLSIASPLASGFVNAGNAAAFPVTGNCSETGATVTLSGSASGSGVCAAGVFTGTLNYSTVPDGSVLLTADMSSAFGNPAKEASVTLAKQTGGPVVTILSPAPGSLVNVANQHNLVVSGTCTAINAAVKLHGPAIGTAPCQGGAYSASVDLSASLDGNLTLLADQVDTAGNPSASAVLPLLKEATPPVLSFSSPVAAAYVNATEVNPLEVSGSCSDEGGTIVLGEAVGTVGAAAASTTCLHGSWLVAVPFTAVKDGPQTITADSTDQYGNKAARVTVAFNKLATPPKLTITTSLTYINSKNQKAFTLSGTCSAEERLVSLTGDVSDAAVCVSQAWSRVINLSGVADGPVSIAASLTDLAGNYVSVNSVGLVKKVSLPSVSIVMPTALSVINAASAAVLTISGLCSEEHQTVTMSAFASTGSAGTAGGIVSAAVCTSGQWAITIDAATIHDGSVTITADISDAAGNPAVEAQATYTKKTTLPIVSITTPVAGSYINDANQGSVLVGGSCSENNQAVTIGGAVAGSATCTGGSWSKSLDLSHVADGTVVLTADLTDAAGNNAVEARDSITKDTSPPVLKLVTPDPGLPAYISAASVYTYLFSGTCSEFGHFVVMTDVSFGSVDVPCQAGQWSKVMDLSGLPEGQTVVTVSQSDVAGNISSLAKTLTKITTPPTTSLTSPLAGGYVNAAGATAVSIAGKCSDEGQVVAVSVTDDTYQPPSTGTGSGSGVGTGTGTSTGASGSSPVTGFLTGSGFLFDSLTCTNNSFSKTYDVSLLADGPLVFTAVHTDVAGNQSLPATAKVTKLTIPPVVWVDVPLASAYANAASSASFKTFGSCSDAGATVYVSGLVPATTLAAAVPVSATSVTCGSGGSWQATLDFSQAADGPLQVVAGTTDKAGNTALPVSVTFAKLTTPPSLAVLSPAASGTYANLQTYQAFGVSGACSAEGQVVIMTGDMAAAVPCTGGSFTFTLDLSPLSDGLVTLSVTTTDVAGNGATSQSVSFTKDTVAPVVGIKAPAIQVNHDNQAAFALSGTCSEDGLPLAVTGSGGGVTALGPVLCSGGGWQGTFDLTQSPDGSVTVLASQVDAALNQGADASLTLTKQTTVPVFSLSVPKDGDYVNLANWQKFLVTGTCSGSGDAIHIRGAVTDDLTCTGTSLSSRIDLSIPADGPLTLTVSETDAFGNKSGSLTVHLTKDTVAPAVSVTLPTYIHQTNKGSVSVAGGCSEVGGTVLLGGAVSGTAPCILSAGSGTGSGSGSFAGSYATTLDFSAASDGPVTETADLNDAAGNPAPEATATATKNDVLPSVSVADPGVVINLLNQSAFALGGACSAEGQAVRLSGAVTLSGAATTNYTCTGGSYSLFYDFSGAGDGPLTVLADLTDLYGNQAPRATRTLLKDTVRPVLTVTTPALSPAPGSFVNLANQHAFLVSGSCSAEAEGSFVTVTVASGLQNFLSLHVPMASLATIPAVCSNGVFSLTFGPATFDVGILADTSGSYAFLIDDTSAAGNPAVEVIVPFTKDTIQPLFTVDLPAGGVQAPVGIANQTAYPLSGTCSDVGLAVTISGDAAGSALCTASADPAAVLPGIWSVMPGLDLSAAADSAAFTFLFDYSDLAGNPAPELSFSVVKKTTQPVVGFTSPAAAGGYANILTAASFFVSGTCSEENQLVKLSGSLPVSGPSPVTALCTGGLFAATLDYSLTPDDPPPAPGLTLLADLTDVAGNEATEKSVVFVKDTVAPTIGITAPANASYLKAAGISAVPVSGACSELEQPVTVTVTGGFPPSTLPPSVTLCDGANWFTSVNMTPASDGVLTITAVISDAAQNPASPPATATVTKKTTVPVFTSLTLIAEAADGYINAAESSGSGPIVSLVGSGYDTATYVILPGGLSCGAFVDFSHGLLTPPSASSLGAAGDGVFSICVSLTDAAGNPPAYGQSGNIVRATSPIHASLALAGDAVPTPPSVVGYVNLADVMSPTSSLNPLVTLAATGQDYQAFIIIDSTIACDTSQGPNFIAPLVTQPPRDIDLPVSGSGSYVVCAKLWDKAGNPPVYAGSPVIVRKVTQPTLASVTLVGDALAVPPASSYINAASRADLTPIVAASGSNYDSLLYLVTSQGATCDATTNFALATLSPPSASSLTTDGSYQICVKLADAAGNPPAYGSSAVVTRKATLPSLTWVALTGDAAPSPPATTGYINLATSGHTTSIVAFAGANYAAAATLYLLTAQGAACDATANFSAASSVPPSASSLAADGSYQICVKLSDAAGNPPVYGATATVVRDTVPPVFTSLALTGDAAVTGYYGYLGISTSGDSTPVVTLSAAHYMSAQYLILPSSATCGGSQNFAAASSGPPGAVGFTADGTFVVCVALSDAAGNPPAYGASPAVTRITTQPHVAITSNGYINAAVAAAYPIGGTCSTAGLTVQLHAGVVAFTAPCTGSGTPTFAASPGPNLSGSVVAEGLVTLTADLTDLAGNRAVQSVVTVTKDTVPPSTTGFAVTGPPSPTSSLTTTVTWTAPSDPHALTYNLSVYASASCTGTAILSLNTSSTSQTVTFAGEGVNYLCVTAFDEAANATTLAPYALEVDLPPAAFTASVTFGAGSGYIGDTWTCSGTDSDPGNYALTPTYQWQTSTNGTGIGVGAWTTLATTTQTLLIDSSVANRAKFAHQYFRCTATFTDPYGEQSASTSPGVQVLNSPPVVTAPAATSANENGNISMTWTATDADGDTVTWGSWTGVPTSGGATTASSTMTWNTIPYTTVSHPANYPASPAVAVVFPIGVTASDGNGGSSASAASLTVNDVDQPPVITVTCPNATQAAAAGESAGFAVTYTVSDPDGDATAVSYTSGVATQTGTTPTPTHSGSTFIWGGSYDWVYTPNGTFGTVAPVLTASYANAGSPTASVTGTCTEWLMNQPQPPTVTQGTIINSYAAAASSTGQIGGMTYRCSGYTYNDNYGYAQGFVERGLSWGTSSATQTALVYSTSGASCTSSWTSGNGYDPTLTLPIATDGSNVQWNFNIHEALYYTYCNGSYTWLSPTISCTGTASGTTSEGTGSTSGLSGSVLVNPNSF